MDPAIYSGGGSPAWLRPILTSPQGRRLGPLFTRDQELGLPVRPVGVARPLESSPTRSGPGFSKPLQAENWDRALWEFTQASRPLGLPERLDELSVPVLVITGDDDRIVPTEQSIRLAGEIPNAELVVIPDCGHVPHEECPEAFLAGRYGVSCRPWNDKKT